MLSLFYAGGLELQFFESAKFEAENPLFPEENSVIIARNALRLIMMGWQSDWRQIILTPRVLKAIFFQRDHTLLLGMRLAFQQGFYHVYEQLKNKRLNRLQLNQAQLYLSNCMSFLPFSDINPYESITIPEWVNEKWCLIEYKVIPIELISRTGIKKLFMAENDRVFAYGLEPITNIEAESHLLFMGTTYPAGQGFISQVETDLESFETLGKKLYRSGRERLINWVNYQPKKIHVCGMSLGASLALLLAIDQGDKLTRIDALNPAGLYLPWRKSRFDRWDELMEKPFVCIQKQRDDPVSKLGIWKKEWQVLQITPPTEIKGNPFLDHGINYAGFSDTCFEIVDVIQDNEARKLRNFWIYTLGRSLLYYCAVFPYRYGFLTFFRAIVVASSLLTADNNIKKPFCHSPSIARNKTLDIYQNYLEGIAFLAEDLQIYYQAKRCLLKNKPLISETMKATGKFGEYSKNDVLKRDKKEIISVTTTKAKIHDIRKTVRIIKRIGFFNEFILKSELQKQHDDYRQGKINYA